MLIDYHQQSFIFILILLASFFVIPKRPKVDLVLSVVALYFVMHNIFFTFLSDYILVNFSFPLIQLIKTNVSFHLSITILLMYFVNAQLRKIIFVTQYVLKILSLIVIVDLIQIFAFNRHDGLFGDRSLESVTGALLIPFCFTFSRPKKLFKIVSFLFILFSFLLQSSTAILISLVFLTFISNNFFGVKDIKFSIIGYLHRFSIPIVTLSAYFFKPDWLTGSGRLENWKTYFEFFNTNVPSKLFGFGGGSFESITFFINQYDSQTHLFMHNDFLQILFEYGYIGLFLILVLIILTTIEVRRDKFMLSLICTQVIAMLFYFPCHSLPTQLILMSTLVYVLSLQSESKCEYYPFVIEISR